MENLINPVPAGGGLALSVLITPATVHANQADKDTQRYIVQFNRAAELSADAVPQLASQLSTTLETQPKRVFSNLVKGFSIDLAPDQVAIVRDNPNVARVVPNILLWPAETVQFSPGWGLDRIDQRDANLDNYYLSEFDGEGIDVYVIDNGVVPNHPEFDYNDDNGQYLHRLTRLFNVFNELDENEEDEYCPNNPLPPSCDQWSCRCVDPASGYCKLQADVAGEEYGHGSHVAGLVGGKTWGAAKAATVKDLIAANCHGIGTLDWFVAALEEVMDDRGSKQDIAIVNMSLKSPAIPPDNWSEENQANYAESVGLLETTIRDVINQYGVLVVAAAGNGWDDNGPAPESACNFTPARMPEVLTVGASNQQDQRAPYSNYGGCVDILAPGNSIRSIDSTGSSASTTKSGTSMATPLVAGVAAVHAETDPEYFYVNPGALRSALIGNATTGTLSDLQGSPNRLLHNWHNEVDIPDPDPDPGTGPGCPWKDPNGNWHMCP